VFKKSRPISEYSNPTSTISQNSARDTSSGEESSGEVEEVRGLCSVTVAPKRGGKINNISVIIMDFFFVYVKLKMIIIVIMIAIDNYYYENNKQKSTNNKRHHTNNAVKNFCVAEVSTHHAPRTIEIKL
jgi:hypothetical protein